jgi:hypothetical protein
MSYFYKENAYLESLIAQYFEKLSLYNDQNCKGELSVILLGSLSRGEGTWIETENGPLMLSDIEYFTVYPDGFTGFDEFSKKESDIARSVFGEDRSSLFHIDNSFVSKSALASIERKLLTYDAKCMGKTVVGKDCLSLIPEITLENINLWDIKDILTHRAFSVLYYGFPLKKEGNETEYRYNLAKNSLDLMTVTLVNHGLLESGFVKRLEIIKTLKIPEEIKRYFEFCLSIKLSSDCSFYYNTEEMEKVFVYLLKELYKNFNIPVKNIFINFKNVTRRMLGIIKRALIYKSFPSSSHLTSLIDSIENGAELSAKQKKTNLILNGYPTK